MEWASSHLSQFVTWCFEMVLRGSAPEPPLKEQRPLRIPGVVLFERIGGDLPQLGEFIGGN